MYVKLSRGIAADRDLLELACSLPEGDDPNLFLAAVHFLLLKGEKHDLRRFYPSLNGRLKANPFPAFRSFCLEHRDQLRSLLRKRSVQTNEVGRCAVLLPAFQLVEEIGEGKPMALIDLGTSAGLILLWDYYAYDYGTAGVYGRLSAPVRVSCDIRGNVTPPLSSNFAHIVSRVGIDTHPVNLKISDAALWLRALVWPEHQNRALLLERAIEVAKRHPPRLIAGDIAQKLPKILEDLPTDCTPCAICSFTFRQLSTQSCRALFRILRNHSVDKPLFLILLDSFGKSFATLFLIAFRNNEMEQPIELARCDYHGIWLRWLHRGRRERGSIRTNRMEALNKSGDIPSMSKGFN